MVGIAQTLRARGHEIAFVTDAGNTTLLSRVGFERIPRGAEDGPSFQVPHWFQPMAIAVQVKHIEYALQRFPADVLLGQQLTLGPLIVGERRRLPVGLLGLCTYLWPQTDEVAQREERSKTEERLVWRYGEMLKFLNQGRALFRLPAYGDGCRETPLLGDVFMLRSVPELEIGFQLLPDRVHLVGSCLWEPQDIDAEVEDWLEAASFQGPCIYVQHGRFFGVPSFWPDLVIGLGDSELRVVASVGRMDYEVGELPDNFLVRPHVNQGRVLRRARAVVASANTTVILGAIEAGVPCLLIPAGGEQPDMAELCERAGFAKVLRPADATPENIRRAVDALLNDRSYSERASHYQAAFSKVDRFETAADLLERLGTTRIPVLRDSALDALEQIA